MPTAEYKGPSSYVDYGRQGSLTPIFPNGPYDTPKPSLNDDEENMDVLIEELESVRGIHDDEDDSQDESGYTGTVPDELLRTDPLRGLDDKEVLTRRKKYGLNKLKEDKQNHYLKFLSFFVGPIQFVMEVRSFLTCFSLHLN